VPPSPDRASAADLMQFATGDGRAAGHIGAVLLLGAAPAFTVAEARRVLGERIRAVPRLRQRLYRAPLLLLKVHKASFVLWFGAMTIHVPGHLGEMFRLAPRDWLRRTRRDVTGAAPRQWLIAASLVAGCMLGFLLLSHVGHWLAVRPGG
jgi:hypothetical protein